MLDYTKEELLDLNYHGEPLRLVGATYSNLKDKKDIEDLEKQIAIKALNFDDIKIKNIMVKKENINFLNIDANSKEILNNIDEFKIIQEGI